jgi:hypothetical protein
MEGPQMLRSAGLLLWGHPSLSSPHLRMSTRVTFMEREVCAMQHLTVDFVIARLILLHSLFARLKIFFELSIRLVVEIILDLVLCNVQAFCWEQFMEL